MRKENVLPALVLRLVLLIGLGWYGPSITVAAEETAVTEITRADAYRQLRRGDELRERREWAEAAYAYQTALERYRVLARNAPAWEQDYFRFRIGYCERELALIVRSTGRSVDEWLAERAGEEPPVTDQYRTRYYSLLEETRYLRNQLDELMEELEVFREMEALEQERDEQRMPRPEPEPPPRVEPERTPPEQLSEPPRPRPRLQEPPTARPVPRR